MATEFYSDAHRKSDSSSEALVLEQNQSTDTTREHDDQDATRPDAEQPVAPGVERRKSPRVRLDSSSDNLEQRLANEADRRKSERRSMDTLRAEALKNLVQENETKNRSVMRFAIPRSGMLKPARLLLLMVALLSGGMAAFLAIQRDPEVAGPVIQPVAEIVPETRTKILVAKEAIGIGQQLSPASVAWEDWPEGAVRPDYITVKATPEAITDMSGAVARFEIFPGEPIRAQKLAQAGQGYLSAILDAGMRGVSVSVTAASASGGFIVPNDHVDIIATRVTDMARDSETILHNVRVLAINSRLGETGKTGAPADPDNPRAQIFENQAIATLELDPIQAEVIISAAEGGSLSLVLLSISDIAKIDNIEQRPANAAIRVSSPFWLE